MKRRNEVMRIAKRTRGEEVETTENGKRREDIKERRTPVKQRGKKPPYPSTKIQQKTLQQPENPQRRTHIEMNSWCEL